jgi:hypothetical protein
MRLRLSPLIVVLIRTISLLRAASNWPSTRTLPHSSSPSPQSSLAIFLSFKAKQTSNHLSLTVKVEVVTKMLSSFSYSSIKHQVALIRWTKGETTYLFPLLNTNQAIIPTDSQSTEEDPLHPWPKRSRLRQPRWFWGTITVWQCLLARLSRLITFTKAANLSMLEAQLPRQE